MHQAVRRAGLTIHIKTVRIAMTVFDPVGVANRAKRKLIRRRYRNLGPNYAWHIFFIFFIYAFFLSRDDDNPRRVN